MDARANRFIEISSELTGFCRVALAGTGMSDDYLAALDAVLPAGVLDGLLEQWRGAGRDNVLGDATLGPVARNIVLLWYRGAWTPLPNEWRVAHGASPLDIDRVISARAYRAGLQWAGGGRASRRRRAAGLRRLGAAARDEHAMSRRAANNHDEMHDVVVVGAGVAGALTAKRLSEAGLRVLVLEAGPASSMSLDGYEAQLETFYATSAKGPESAWPPAAGAPQPDIGDLAGGDGYFVQQGPQAYGSTYTRRAGGSTLHWLGVSLRMLPEDFSLRSRHGVGVDWPLAYDDLEPWYRAAETELGVAADVADQAHNGLSFPPGYDYPMRRIPQSWSDKQLASQVDGLAIEMGGESFGYL